MSVLPAKAGLKSVGGVHRRYPVFAKRLASIGTPCFSLNGRCVKCARPINRYCYLSIIARRCTHLGHALGALVRSFVGVII
jgi:hypothetical protein